MSTGKQPSGTGQRPEQAHHWLVLAAVIISIEAVALVAFMMRDLSSSGSLRVSTGVGVVVVLVGYALALVVGSVALVRGRFRARAPLIVAHLMQVLIAFNLRDYVGLALAVAGPALVVLAILIAPVVGRDPAGP